MEAAKPPLLQIIKNHFEKALECLNAGILEEDMGNKARAIEFYKLGQQHLLKGSEISSTCKYAQKMEVEMNKLMSNTTARLVNLESSSGPGLRARLYPDLQQLLETTSTAINNQLPSRPSTGFPDLPDSPAVASEVPSKLPPANTPKPTDKHLSVSRNNGRAWPLLPKPQQISQQQDVFFLPHGVQIFFVTADGQVSAPSKPGYLRITLNCTQYSDRYNNNNSRYPLAFLLVCDWQYPLFPDSPVLLSNTGMFTFPDTLATEPGSYVGIVLSSDLPATAKATFQKHLSVFTQFRVQSEDKGAESAKRAVADITWNDTSLISSSEGTATPQDTAGKEENIPKWSRTISQGILAGSSWLSRGLVKGAEAAGKTIQEGAVKLREHITPEETPAEVSPQVTKGLQVAKKATGGAVKVSQSLVNGFSAVVERIGQELTPHVQKHGSKLIPKSVKNNKEDSTNMDGAKLVASSSIKGLSAVWSSLGTAAKTIGRSASSETVLTVKHKYGEKASQATDTAVQSVVNVGVTAFNMDNLALKAVLKSAGKQTLKAMDKENKTMETDKKDMEKTPLTKMQRKSPDNKKNETDT